jgi:hypothetical protein
MRKLKDEKMKEAKKWIDEKKENYNLQSTLYGQEDTDIQGFHMYMN